MALNGVSTAGINYGARLNMLSSQKQLNETSQKIGGLQGQTYGEFYQKANVLLGFESQFSVLDGYLQENSLVDFKLQRIENSLDSIKDTYSRFRSAFLYARNGQDYGTVGLRERANESLRQLISDLNGSDEEGAYLFAGSRWNIAPVSMEGMQLPVPGGGPHTQYYQGDHLLPQKQINDNQTLVYGITADHPAFEQLLRAYNLVANAPDQEPARQTYMDEAFTTLNSGFEALVDVMSDVGHARRQISEANQSVLTLKETAEDHIQEIVQADPAEVISRFTALQAQLQSALMVIQRLQQTSLANMM